MNFVLCFGNLPSFEGFVQTNWMFHQNKRTHATEDNLFLRNVFFSTPSEYDSKQICVSMIFLKCNIFILLSGNNVYRTLPHLKICKPWKIYITTQTLFFFTDWLYVHFCLSMKSQIVRNKLNHEIIYLAFCITWQFSEPKEMSNISIIVFPMQEFMRPFKDFCILFFMGWNIKQKSDASVSQASSRFNCILQHHLVVGCFKLHTAVSASFCMTSTVHTYFTFKLDVQMFLVLSLMQRSETVRGTMSLNKNILQ